MSGGQPGRRSSSHGPSTRAESPGVPDLRRSRRGFAARCVPVFRRSRTISSPELRRTRTSPERLKRLDRASRGEGVDVVGSRHPTCDRDRSPGPPPGPLRRTSVDGTRGGSLPAWVGRSRGRNAAFTRVPQIPVRGPRGLDRRRLLRSTGGVVRVTRRLGPIVRSVLRSSGGLPDRSNASLLSYSSGTPESRRRRARGRLRDSVSRLPRKSGVPEDSRASGGDSAHSLPPELRNTGARDTLPSFSVLPGIPVLRNTHPQVGVNFFGNVFLL